MQTVNTSRYSRSRDKPDKINISHIEADANGQYVEHAGVTPGPADRDDATLTKIRQVVVETLDGRSATIDELLDGPALLVLLYERAGKRHRTVAEIAWIEERLDPDVGFVMVWARRPVRYARLSPSRSGTQSVIDISGELCRVLETAGKRRALLIDLDAGTVTTATEESEVFSLGREIRLTDERGNDHMIDLGDLT
jgi:hypothetical protein